MDYDMFIPITAFLSLAAVIGLFLYFRFRARFEVHRTVRAAIERGQLMTPEFLERLGDAHPARGALRDLRIGVTSMALGLSIALFGFLLGEIGAIRPLLAIGNIPFLVGLAFVGLWKFAPRDDART